VDPPARGRGPFSRLAVIDTEPVRRGPDRRVDRGLTFAGLAVAILFLIAALVSLLLPADVRLGSWLPLHLALAGAAGTAIAAMLPFFVAALAVASPAPAALHGGAIALVAAGAALAAFGRALAGGAVDPVAAAGAALYVAGIAAVGVSAALPLRRAAAPHRPATELAYAVALVNVAVGASLAGLYVAGWPAVVSDWLGLRVAHAWLNVFGFVGLVVAGTLIHFAPTVFGSRIRRRRAGWLAVAALAAGPPLVALGHAFTDSSLVRVGTLAALVGAAALVVHGAQAYRDRAGWTSDAPWHRFTSWSLLAAPAWLVLALLIAAARTLPGGADPAAWRLDEVLAPLVAGFAVQVLLGALAHLVPAIGPGGPEHHAAERRLLGREATVRLLAWNAGTGALALGLAGGWWLLAAAGAALLATTLAATLLLLALCVYGRG
jgi:nitrite reductase (NO-forming)